MPPLPPLLNKYIIKSNIKINQSNLKTFCKCCIDVLGEQEGKKTFFPNKKDRIIQHLRKCEHFISQTTPEERAEVDELATAPLSANKRPCVLSFLLLL